MTARSIGSGISLNDRTAGTPANRLAGAVDSVGAAREAAGADIPKDGSTNRAGPGGRADDGDARRLEKRPQGGDDCDVVALVDPFAVPLGRLDGEAHLDRAAFDFPGDVEPSVLEDAKHRAVVGHHLCDERLHARGAGDGRELFDEPCPDAPALELVRDSERHFSTDRIAEPRPARHGDNLLATVVRSRRDQTAAIVPVGRQERGYEIGYNRPHAVEAEAQAVRRETGEEGEQTIRVLRNGRAEPKRLTVAEDDIANGHVQADGGIPPWRRHPGR